jgi:hypothetical protein
MAKVTIELVDNDQGEVNCTISFDPPLVPGEPLPLAHRMSESVLRGTKLYPAMRAALLACGQDTGEA